MNRGEALLERLRAVMAEHRPRSFRVRPGERRAAVLVPVIAGPDGADPWLLLEKRASTLSQHAGQYGFPGGSIEDGDSSAEDAALREAREETGMDPAFVEVLGRLSDIRTPTGFVITPVVGLVRRDQDLRPAEDEVEELIRVPLSSLTRPGAFQTVSLPSRGVLVRGEALVHEGRVIWGATARMLLELRRILTKALDEDS